MWENASVWMPVSLISIVVVGIVFRLLGRGRRGGSPDPERVEDVDSREERRHALSDLENFARELEARLDGKIREIKALLVRADDLSSTLRDQLGEAPPADDSAVTQIEEVEGIDRIEAVLNEEDSAFPRGPFTGQWDDRERDRVAALFRDGMKVEAIAARLGLPRGEVELILSLRRNKN